mmetsp:Transcript_72422/g.159998  ORF Transcript_72422/g.159998 Transcript_72422/m.159998 type:complete len:345 (+) Transcript_72422:1466-2500(+)
MHQGSDRGRLTFTLLGHQLQSPLVGASEVDRNEDRINRQRCQGTPWSLLEHEDGDHPNLAEHGPQLEQDQIAIRNHIRDVFHDANLQILNRHHRSGLLGISQILPEEVHAQVITNVEAHLQDSHLKVVRAQENQVGQDPGQTQTNGRGVAIAMDPQALLGVLVLEIQHRIDQVDLDKDGGQIIGIAQVRQEQHQDGFPPNVVHVIEAELHEGPQQAEADLIQGTFILGFDFISEIVGGKEVIVQDHDTTAVEFGIQQAVLRIIKDHIKLQRCVEVFIVDDSDLKAPDRFTWAEPANIRSSMIFPPIFRRKFLCFPAHTTRALEGANSDHSHHCSGFLFVHIKDL